MTAANLPFDPKGDIFHWGPVPGKFFYCSAFTTTHYKYFRAKYHLNWSETLWLFIGDRMFWVNDQNDITAAGIKVFLKYLMPVLSRKKIYREWQGHTKKLLLFQKQIANANLAKLTNKQLGKLWHDFHEVYIKFWVTGSVPELANYGSESYLKGKLQKVIKNENDLSIAMEILTAPMRASFYQEEEIALSKAANLNQHQQKYFWLKNSYAGTAVLPVKFFADRKAKFAHNLGLETKTKIKATLAKKKSIQKQFGLSQEIMAIGQAISDGVGWQDERKKYIFMILHYQDVMLAEVTRRFGYTSDELHRAWYYEIEKIIGGQNLHFKLTARKDGFGVQFFHTCKELNASETENMWKTYETKTDQNTTETKGIVACKGKTAITRGVVHIVLDPNNIGDFKTGEVLVAPMTSPEYIFAMKLASAVVTDTGGLTSHAAIVSRELNIPCVVGAKGSTVVFKNGDLVEINSATGSVKLNYYTI
ncbi:MAG: PEP-utilizing enzyme [Candidatus Magasanikbacteria bacterium]